MRSQLAARLAELEPDRPVALAAFLNGTPNLTDLSQLSMGEVTVMLERLTLPTYVLAAWNQHSLTTLPPEVEGARWLL